VLGEGEIIDVMYTDEFNRMRTLEGVTREQARVFTDSRSLTKEQVSKREGQIRSKFSDEANIVPDRNGIEAALAQTLGADSLLATDQGLYEVLRIASLNRAQGRQIAQETLREWGIGFLRFNYGNAYQRAREHIARQIREGIDPVTALNNARNDAARILRETEFGQQLSEQEQQAVIPRLQRQLILDLSRQQVSEAKALAKEEGFDKALELIRSDPELNNPTIISELTKTSKPNMVALVTGLAARQRDLEPREGEYRARVYTAQSEVPPHEEQRGWTRSDDDV
ncbi:MAG TPA: hypothetical protein VJH22_04840, partial [Candidatus Nanoarchaeia archaeon]|nr:hypothetical protein [Candidatus Nanoarchaeia archaeon]